MLSNKNRHRDTCITVPRTPVPFFWSRVAESILRNPVTLVVAPYGYGKTHAVHATVAAHPGWTMVEFHCANASVEAITVKARRALETPPLVPGTLNVVFIDEVEGMLTDLADCGVRITAQMLLDLVALPSQDPYARLVLASATPQPWITARVVRQNGVSVVEHCPDPVQTREELAQIMREFVRAHAGLRLSSYLNCIGVLERQGVVVPRRAWLVLTQAATGGRRRILSTDAIDRAAGFIGVTDVAAWLPPRDIFALACASDVRDRDVVIAGMRPHCAILLHNNYPHHPRATLEGAVRVLEALTDYDVLETPDHFRSYPEYYDAVTYGAIRCTGLPADLARCAPDCRYYNVRSYRSQRLKALPWNSGVPVEDWSFAPTDARPASLSLSSSSSSGKAVG